MAAEVSSKYAVQMHGITKRFGSFYALTDVDLDVEKGTIHSILGENGAGKSTLMNVLYGLYQADMGSIYIGGEKVDIKNPTAAIEHGIGMVHQHFMLVENFTVTQNIVLGSEPTKSGITLNMKQARKNVLEIVEKYGLDVNPDAKIRLAIMRNLIKDGKTIIIITHKLKEIQASSDMCTIIRRGHYIDTVPVKGVSEDDLATMMVGHAVKLVVDKAPSNPGRVVLDIQNLYVKNEQRINAVKDFNLQVRAGEIVGIAGIDGNGQQELMEAVNNLKRCKGKIILDGEEIQNRNPKYGIDRGMATIPADRHKDGLVLGFSVYENAILELIQAYDVRPEDCGPRLAGGLSGGNQQKIIIGREIANEPKLLIAIQPTRGLDVGAIENVHKMLINERDKGVAVLLISFELDEVMNVSDRIAVIYDGHIQQIFEQGTVDNRTLGRVMAGGTVDEEELKAVKAAVEAEDAAALAHDARLAAIEAGEEIPEEADKFATKAFTPVTRAEAEAGETAAEEAAMAAQAAADAPADIIAEAVAAIPTETPEAPAEATAAPAEAPEEPMTEAQVRENIRALEKQLEDTQKQLIAMQQKLSEMQ